VEADAPVRVRVLVVDDHATYLKALEAVLATACSIDVVGRAANGREAVALALSLAPDVIVLDIRMPVLDGFATMRRLREVGSRAAVLVLTASDDPRDADRAFELGAVGFIPKDRMQEMLIPSLVELGGRLARAGV
jgi:DNA-binding NarL/FixJ family response regulator